MQARLAKVPRAMGYLYQDVKVVREARVDEEGLELRTGLAEAQINQPDRTCLEVQDLERKKH